MFGCASISDHESLSMRISGPLKKKEKYYQYKATLPTAGWSCSLLSVSLPCFLLPGFVAGPRVGGEEMGCGSVWSLAFSLCAIFRRSSLACSFPIPPFLLMGLPVSEIEQNSLGSKGLLFSAHVFYNPCHIYLFYILYTY